MTGLRGETYELFHNRGDGTFEDASASSGLLPLSRPWNGWSCGLVDLDNDGWLDLFVACGGLDANELQPNRVFRNQGGHWTDVSAGVGPGWKSIGHSREWRRCKPTSSLRLPNPSRHPSCNTFSERNSD